MPSSCWQLFPKHRYVSSDTHIPWDHIYILTVVRTSDLTKYCAIMESRVEIMMISETGHKLHRHSEPSLS